MGRWKKKPLKRFFVSTLMIENMKLMTERRGKGKLMRRLIVHAMSVAVLLFFCSISGASPDDHEFLSYCAQGSAAHAAGKYDEAVDYFKQAIALKPEVAQPYFDLGLAYDRLRKSNLAIENYEAGLKINPNFVPAYIMLSKAYVAGRGDLGKALWAAREARKREPHNQAAIQTIQLIEEKIKSMPGGVEMLKNEEKYAREGLGVFQSGNFTYIGPIKNAEATKTNAEQSTERDEEQITKGTVN